MKKVEINLELLALFIMLKDGGASHVVIIFSGGGDEGAFDEKYAIPNSLVAENGDLIYSHWESEFDGLIKDMPEIPIDKTELLETLAQSYTSVHDWWNNDGGDGYIVINLTDLTYYTHYSINTISSEEFSESGEIEIN